MNNSSARAAYLEARTAYIEARVRFDNTAFGSDHDRARAYDQVLELLHNWRHAARRDLDSLMGA